MQTASERPGLITADSLYTLEELGARLRLGKAALRQARRKGLKIRRIGRRAYVLGRDVIEWFDKSAEPL
jgi:hypothetical protein